MPRIPRPVVPGQPLHLIQRGNNRIAAFLDEEDFARYLRVLREASTKTGCAVHAYVLMSNHVHLLECMRYIELNPVRAGIVDAPARYRWSSFRANALGDVDPVLAPHPVFFSLGRSSAERGAAYRGLFDVPLDPEVMDAIRRAARRGTVLGTVACRTRLESTLKRSLGRLPHGGARRGAMFDAARGRLDARASSPIFNKPDPLNFSGELR